MREGMMALFVIQYNPCVARVLLFIGWLACVVYATIPSFWLLIHPRAEYWRSRQFSPYFVLVPAWMGMWVVAAILTWPWRLERMYQGWWGWVPAVALLSMGIWLYRRAGAHFTWQQLGGIPELIAEHRDQRLATSGIRSYVRHPVYLGHLLEMLAWSFGTGLVVCFALTAFAVIIGARMIEMEDRELEARFGEPYREYRRKVGSVIPSLRRHP